MRKGFVKKSEWKSLEDVLIEIVKKMKPEVRRFVEAQKRKDTRTVEQMYIENLRKEKRKNKSCTKKTAKLVAVNFINK